MLLHLGDTGLGRIKEEIECRNEGKERERNICQTAGRINISSGPTGYFMEDHRQ